MAEVTGAALIEMPFEAYDLKAQYDEHVRPLADKLIDLCDELGMPVLLVVATGQDKTGQCVLSQSCCMTSPERTPIPLMAARLRLEDKDDDADNLELIGSLRAEHAAERLKSAH